MKSKFKVNLPQVVNKTEASYQHHLLEMMSQLVKEQKASNMILKNINAEESPSLIRHKSKPNFESIHSRKRSQHQQDRDQSYYSQILKSIDQNKKMSMLKNLNKPQYFTYQDKSGGQSRAEQCFAYNSGQNSPRHKSMNQENYIQMPQSVLQTLVSSINNLQSSITKLESKINQQNQFNNNQLKRKIQQKQQAVKQKLIQKQSVKLHYQNHFKEIVSEIQSLHQTIKTKSQTKIEKVPVPQNVIISTNNNESNQIPRLVKNSRKSRMSIQIFQKQKNQQEKPKQTQNLNAIDNSKIVVYPSKRSMKNYSQIFDQPIQFDISNNQNLTGGQGQINKFQNMKQYARLSQIQSHCDKRQIKVRISFEDMFRNAGKVKIENKKQFQAYITEWLGITFRATASICWNMLQSHQLSFDQVQILFTQNIIFNFIELMKDVRDLNLKEQLQSVPQIINRKSKNILDFLCHQYPQTKVEAPNMNLRLAIPNIDQKGKIQYDLIGQSGVTFTYQPQKNYAPQIMQFINYLIDKSNKEYQNFERFMIRLFSKLYVPQNQRSQKDVDLNTNDPNQLAYQEKVKKYTKYIIARKIPQNTPKYTKQQIETGIFYVKSATILRVIAKWAEQLIYVIKHPDVAIKDWFYPFKNHKGQQQYALYAIRKGIYKNILENRKKMVFDKLQQIRKDCYKIQGELSKIDHISNEQSVFLSQEQTNVGLFASNIKNALSSYLCAQLNHVIHFLLKSPLKTDQKNLGIDPYFQAQARNQLNSINLVTFRIFDLLRCKCISGQSQVLWLMNQLRQIDKRTSEEDGNLNFKVVRFKDRLNKGTRDVLINAKLGNGPVFQMQLSILSQVEQKQDLLDKYNHFLYELKRAELLGPLIENVSIWTSKEQKFSYFDNLVKQKFERGKVVPLTHKCGVKMKEFLQPMICQSCNIFFHIPRTCLGNWICSKCSQKFCGECLLAGLNSNQRKTSVFQKKLPKQFLDLLQEYDYKKESQIPKYVVFFKKNFLKPQVSFMMTYQVQQSQQNTKTKMVETVIRQSKILSRNFIRNQYEMYKMNNLLVYKFIKPEVLQEMTVDQIRILDVSSDNELIITNMTYEPNYLKNIKTLVTQHKKEKFLNQLEKIVQNRKIVLVRLKKHLILLKVSLQQAQLQKDLTIRDNLNKLKSFAQASSSVVSIERKNVSVQLSMLEQKLGVDLYNNMCNKVERLYLNYGLMTSIEAVRVFSKIKSLYITDNKLTSLKGIETLKNLKNFNFERNQIQSLEQLTGLSNVQVILGNKNKIKSLKGIQNLVILKQLSLQDNQVQRLDYFEKLSNLKFLYLRSNQIKEIKDLQSLINLQRLTLSYNPISVVKNIKCLKNLKSLSLGMLNLTEVPPEIKQLTSLEQLILDKNNLKEISVCTGMENLKRISLKYNKIDSLEIFRDVDLYLTHLNLNGNNLTKLSGIKQIADTLQQLSILQNPISDVTQLVGVHMQFRVTWSKDSFTPQAGKLFQRILKKDPTLLKEFFSAKNLSQHSAHSANSAKNSAAECAQGGQEQSLESCIGNMLGQFML